MSSEKEELSKKQIERIRLAAIKISEIYKDLTYTFLEEREKKREIEEISLTKIIKEELKYFEVLAEKKDININTNLDEVNYIIDKNDFIRVFNNVLSNAIKYNKKAGFINIDLNQKELIIQDSGIGIAESKIKDIFTRYYRATNDNGGFGIGLNIVQNICQEYEIKVNVQSKLKEGSTFTFTF